MPALIVLAFITGACGSTTALSPAEQLKADAAQQYEKLDSTYFDASHAAVEKGKATGGADGYVEAMNGLADANSAFFRGLEQITFPADDKADVDALKTVTVKIETETLLEVKNAGSTTIADDLGVRNDADRALRRDLGLDPSEVPS